MNKQMNRQTKRGFAAALVIVIIAIGILVSGVAYFYKDTHKTQPDQVSYSRNTNQVLKDLNKATYTLQEETAKLSALEKLTGGTKGSGSNSSVDVRAAILSDIANIKAKAVLKTDVFFKDPETPHPKITVPTATVAIQTAIDAKRALINALLVTWENKISTNPTQTTTSQTAQKNAALIAEAKTNISTIQTYITELDKIVDALTPANSGLTQTQIDNYEAVIIAAQKEVVDLNTTLATLPTQTTQTNTSVTNQTQQQTQQQIQDQIAAQQQVVNQAVEQVNTLQNELQQTQQAEQQQQGTNQTPAATTTSNAQNQTNNTQTDTQNTTDNSHVIQSNNSDPNPDGEVKLLQGW